MLPKRGNDGLPEGAPPEKIGRLSNANEDEWDPELDEEVAAELREFERLQEGLLDCPGEDVGEGNGDGSSPRNEEQGGVIDMDVDDLEQEIAEARRRSALFHAGERNLVRAQQRKGRMQQRRRASKKAQPLVTQNELSPNKLVQGNVRCGSDLTVGSSILNDEELSLTSPQSMAAAKRVECSTPTTTMSSPRTTQLTDMKSVTKETFQDPVLKSLLRPALPQPSPSKDTFHSVKFTPKEAFVDSSLKNPLHPKSSTKQDLRDPILGQGTKPSPNESEKALPSTSPSKVKDKHQGKLVILEPRDNDIHPKNPQYPVGAIYSDSPNRPIVQSLPHRIGNNPGLIRPPLALGPVRIPPPKDERASSSPGPNTPQPPKVPAYLDFLNRPIVQSLPHRIENNPGFSLPPEPIHISPTKDERASSSPGPNTPKPPKDPAYLDFLEKSKGISRINLLPAQPAPTCTELNPFDLLPSREDQESTANYCIIEQFIQKRFSNCLDCEKSELVRADRPKIWCPELSRFKVYYDAVKWLVGCNELKRFFCWPCLCFNSKGIWSLTCDNEENVFERELNKHKQTPFHQEAVKQLEHWEAQEKTNSVSTIIAKKRESGKWMDQELEDIIEKGKQCPILKNIEITFRSKRDRNIVFQEFYDRFKWICGCIDSQKFYCWPCLLFTPDNWSYVGAIDSPGQDFLQHDISLAHLNSCLKLGKKEYELKKKRGSPNEKPDNMRRFVASLVETFCAEKKKYRNTGLSSVDFVNLLHFPFNENLKKFFLEHANSSDPRLEQFVATRTTPILDSVEFFIKDEILKEIKSSEFVSLIFDHSSGHSMKTILSVIARYVDRKGHVQERFVKLLNLGYNSLPSTISGEFFQVVTELQCRFKLIGYTYDGYLVKPESIPDFNAKVRKVCPNARFYHYTKHNFLRILKQALCHIPVCRSVLQGVQRLVHFLESTPNATKRLVATMKATEKRDLGEFWKSADFIKTVYIYQVVIVEILQSSASEGKSFVRDWDFLEFFKEPRNRFFITVMARIFNTVEDLTAELDREVGIDNLKATANNTVLKIQKLGRNFDNVVESASSHLDTAEERVDFAERLDGLQDQFADVIRAVMNLIENRTAQMESGYFRISKEPGSANFIELKQQMLALESRGLPSNINSARLSRELKFLRNSPMSGLDLPQILRRIHEYDISKMVPELVKFLQLALTVPKNLYDASTTTTVERVWAYIYSKDKKPLQNAQISKDSLFWIEQGILSNLQKDPTFYQKVATRVETILEKSRAPKKL